MNQPPPPPNQPPNQPPPGWAPPPQQPPAWGQAQPPYPVAPPPYPPAGFQQPPPPRRGRVVPVVIAVVAAVLVLAAAILVPVLLSGDDDDEPAVADRRGDDASGPSDLDDVQSFEDLTNQHLDIGEEHSYPQSPPVGGDHAPIWLECGVYDEPVPVEYVVHDLEHGTTWLTYRPDDLDADGIERLAEQLPANGIMSPYADQSAPVVITVWGRQLELTGPDDPRIGLFITKFGAGDTAPEPFASCNGGVSPDDLAPLGGPVV